MDFLSTKTFVVSDEASGIVVPKLLDAPRWIVWASVQIRSQPESFKLDAPRTLKELYRWWCIVTASNEREAFNAARSAFRSHLEMMGRSPEQMRTVHIEIIKGEAL